jgi:hypothetical protein
MSARATTATAQLRENVIKQQRVTLHLHSARSCTA